MNEQLREIKESYYDYISKIENGCLMISNLIRQGNYSQAFESIIAFSEGIQWLLSVEKTLNEQAYVINSRITEANDYLLEINTALETQDFLTVADIFEYEIQPIFSSATEWVFVEKSEE